MNSLLLYTTEGCHLCEHAEALMEPLLANLGYSLKKVEISEDDILIENYGIRIPVIRREDKTEDLGWPFTQEEFLFYLK